MFAEFRAAMDRHCGPTWLETLWGVKEPEWSLSTTQASRGWLRPTSFLEFATQYQMPLVAYYEAEENLDEYNGNIDGPKLLYYAILCNATEDSPVRAVQWEDLAKLFLRLGLDPNGLLTIPVEKDQGLLMQEDYEVSDDGFSDNRDSGHGDSNNGDSDYEDSDNGDSDHEDSDGGDSDGGDSVHEDSDNRDSDNRDSDAGDSVHEDSENGDPYDRDSDHGDADATTVTITPLCLALAVAVTPTRGFYPNPRMDLEDRLVNRINILRILVENGGDASRSFKNHWVNKGIAGKERSAVHYLLSKAMAPRAFLNPDLARALTKCVVSFFEHGLDPNVVDSDGRSILECAFDHQPPGWFIETLLERGAKITPKLLCETGRPIAEARILGSARWRKPQYYTPEAREIARKHNSDWPQENEIAGAPRMTKGVYQFATSILNKWL